MCRALNPVGQVLTPSRLENETAGKRTGPNRNETAAQTAKAQVETGSIPGSSIEKGRRDAGPLLFISIRSVGLTICRRFRVVRANAGCAMVRDSPGRAGVRQSRLPTMAGHFNDDAVAYTA